MQNTQNDQTISNMRAQMRSGTVSDQSAAQNRNQVFSPNLTHSQYVAPAPNQTYRERQRAGFKAPQWLIFFHNYRHIILAGCFFLLPCYMYYAPDFLRPDALVEGTRHGPSTDSPVFFTFISAVFAFIAYSFLKKIRQTAQNLADIRNAGKWGVPFQLGAALGLGIFVYRYIESHSFPLTLPDSAEVYRGLIFEALALTFLGGRILDYVARKYFDYGLDEG